MKRINSFFIWWMLFMIVSFLFQSTGNTLFPEINNLGIIIAIFSTLLLFFDYSDLLIKQTRR